MGDEYIDLIQILATKNKRYSSFSEKFKDVEKLVSEKQGQLFSFNYPESDYKLVFSVYRGQLYLEIKNEDDKTVLSMGRENSEKDLYNKGIIFEEYMYLNNLSFIPKSPIEFSAELSRFSPGDIITLNNELSIICIQSGNECIYKELYQGNIAEITMDSFKKSTTYNLDNQRDVEYLYSHAYNIKTSSVNIKYSTEKDGYETLTKIEKDIKKGDIKDYAISNILLRGIRQNKEVAWFDSLGKKINRKDLAILIGWAKSTISEVDAVYWNNDKNDFEYTQDCPELNNIFKSINQELIDKDFAYVASKALKLSRDTNNKISINITGLDETENGFFLKTFSFAYGNKKETVFEISYEEDNQTIKDIKEITVDEFTQFCEKIYDERCSYIIQNYEEMISPNIQLSEVQKKIINDKLLEETKKNMSNKDINIMNIKQSDINNLSSDIDNFLDKYFKDTISDTEYIPASKIFSNEIEEKEIE